MLLSLHQPQDSNPLPTELLQLDDVAMATPPLPADRPNQTYVTVKAFCAGKAHLPHSLVFEDCEGEPDSVGVQIPVLCFLISHPTKGHALFDLGIRKVRTHPWLLIIVCTVDGR